LEFKKLTLDDIDRLRPYFTENTCRINDCTVGGTFIWRDYHQTEYSLDDDGVLFFKISYPEPAFTQPRGIEPNRESYERIIEYAESNDLPVRLCAVGEAKLEGILELFPGSTVKSDRNTFDYLYNSSDLTTLAGRKYSGQRNHINRFMREHPTWSFEPLTNERIPEVIAFYQKFAQENIKDAFSYNEGNLKSEEVLDNFELYGQYGGVLYVKDVVVGASFGEPLGDTLYVHQEKADVSYHGAYPMLVNQFAKMYVTDEIEHINREEDDGVEGLRTSKMSYHPSMLMTKYTVELKY